MKKLVYIVMCIAIFGCAVSKGLYHVYDNNFQYDKHIGNFFQNYHWNGSNNGDSLKIIVDSFMNDIVYYGKIIKNDNTANFINHKGRLLYNSNNNDSLTQLNFDEYEYIGKKHYSSYDTIVLSKKNDDQRIYSFIQIPLIKTENNYFLPYKNEYYVSEWFGTSVDQINSYWFIYLKTQSPIFSIRNGVVTKIEKNKISESNYGNLIEIYDSINDLKIIYFELGKIKVKLNDEIKKGELIAYSEKEIKNRKQRIGIFIIKKEKFIDIKELYANN